jgi:hypothetical protein
MFKPMRVRALIVVAAVAASLCIAAAPASAQQTGLVNLHLEDVTVQVPIAVAANVCDVNVAVLVDRLRDDAATCDADAEAIAISPADSDGGGGGAGPQEGLVNVSIEDFTVQVPVAVAANICDVNVAVLVGLVDDEAAACEADARAVARDRNE